MTDSSPHLQPNPATAGPTVPPDGPTPVDVVPGNPPVPITVWRTARRDDDHGAAIPARLAARLVAAYSRPEEAVVDLTGDHALTGACVAGHRHHHRAAFTDDASLVIAPPTPTDPRTLTTPPKSDVDDDGGDAREGEGPDVPDVRTWFGDDLTDSHLPPTAHDATDALADGGPLLGRTSLVVAAWPLHADAPANRVRLAWLLAACRDLLRPRGCLILVVVPTGHPPVPEDFTPIVAAAARTGLAYLQHIVAVAAPVDGDSFTFHATDEELLTLAHTDPQRPAVAHVRVHADLLVLTRPPSTATRPARGGRHA